jgi:N-acetylglucosaminyl-diphospho-decaprenol L-rhamnosyltransferase
VVLFASYSGAFGGAERLLIDWAGGLDGDVCLACPEGPLADAARVARIRVFPVRRRQLELRQSAAERMHAAWDLIGHAWELRRLMASLDPNVLVVWGMRSALAWLLLDPTGGRVRRPRVVFQHNDFLPGPLIGWLVRAAAARADLVTVPSHAVARDLDPRLRLGGRLALVHPGIDAKRFDAAATPARPPEALMLGALIDWKRADLALEACALARRQLPELRLRLVGAPFGAAGDRLLGRLSARASQSDLRDAVEFVGAVADPAEELARSTCLLHCAEREPFGLAVLEALAAGRPAVVPAAGGPTEIVDPTCGIEYPPGDAAGAANALTRLLSDPSLATRMGLAGRARAIEQFDPDRSRQAWARAVGRVRSRTRTPSAAPALEIVTVTHNSASVIGRLLSSVERHLPHVRVIVVDCASADDSLSVARRSPVARVVALGENVGFGRACNRGLSEVEAPVTALLNPDVELVDDSLLRLAAEAARRDRDERLLAPLVLRRDGSLQDSVHPAPGAAADLLRALIPYTRLPWRFAAPLAPWQARGPRRVGWAVACALVGRTDTLRRLGPFDEGFFLYGEDLELGLRAADAGVATWFWPSARVLHDGGHATGPAFDGEAFELLARGRRAAVRRRRGRGTAALDDAAQALTFASRIAGKRVLGRDVQRQRRQLEALLAARWAASKPGRET